MIERSPKLIGGKHHRLSKFEATAVYPDNRLTSITLDPRHVSPCPSAIAHEENQPGDEEQNRYPRREPLGHMAS
jgi:hypothetical protein